MTVGIVTGAARGMGYACAERLIDTVDTLLLVDRDEGSVATAAAQLATSRGTAVEPFALDITDRDGLARMAARVAELGDLRAVVHAAGVSPTMAEWQQVIDVDLVATANLVDVLRPIVGNDTAFVCFASMAPWLDPRPVDPTIEAALDDPLHTDFIDRIRDAVGPTIEDSGLAYFWAKRGVHRLVQREAVRLGPLGARICSVSPGIIDTPMGRQEAAAGSTNDMLAGLTPLGREGRPEEVAAAVAFLVSAEASFVNGIDLLVDGGVIAAFRRVGSSLSRG